MKTQFDHHLRRFNGMNKTYYTLEATDGSGKIIGTFETYAEAYHYMCMEYCKGYKANKEPVMYQILRTSTSTWKGSTNTMVQPVWK